MAGAADEFDLDEFLSTLSAAPGAGPASPASPASCAGPPPALPLEREIKFGRILRNAKSIKRLMTPTSELVKLCEVMKVELANKKAELVQMRNDYKTILERVMPLEKLCEEQASELAEYKKKYSQNELDLKALNCHNKQLQLFVKNLQSELEGKNLEKSLENNSQRAHIKNVLLFGNIAESHKKLSKRHQEILKKYRRLIKGDDCIVSDKEDEVEIPPRCDSVDTGIGTSLTVSDDEKIWSPESQFGQSNTYQNSPASDIYCEKDDVNISTNKPKTTESTTSPIKYPSGEINCINIPMKPPNVNISSPIYNNTKTLSLFDINETNGKKYSLATTNRTPSQKNIYDDVKVSTNKSKTIETASSTVKYPSGEINCINEPLKPPNDSISSPIYNNTITLSLFDICETNGKKHSTATTNTTPPRSCTRSPKENMDETHRINPITERVSIAVSPIKNNRIATTNTTPPRKIKYLNAGTNTDMLPRKKDSSSSPIKHLNPSINSHNNLPLRFFPINKTNVTEAALDVTDVEIENIFKEMTFELKHLSPIPPTPDIIDKDLRIATVKSCIPKTCLKNTDPPKKALTANLIRKLRITKLRNRKLHSMILSQKIELIKAHQKAKESSSFNMIPRTEEDIVKFLTFASKVSEIFRIEKKDKIHTISSASSEMDELLLNKIKVLLNNDTCSLQTTVRNKSKVPKSPNTPAINSSLKKYASINRQISNSCTNSIKFSSKCDSKYTPLCKGDDKPLNDHNKKIKRIAKSNLFDDSSDDDVTLITPNKNNQCKNSFDNEIVSFPMYQPSDTDARAEEDEARTLKLRKCKLTKLDKLKRKWPPKPKIQCEDASPENKKNELLSNAYTKSSNVTAEVQTVISNNNSKNNVEKSTLPLKNTPEYLKAVHKDSFDDDIVSVPMDQPSDTDARAEEVEARTQKLRKCKFTKLAKLKRKLAPKSKIQCEDASPKNKKRKLPNKALTESSNFAAEVQTSMSAEESTLELKNTAAYIKAVQVMSELKAKQSTKKSDSSVSFRVTRSRMNMNSLENSTNSVVQSDTSDSSIVPSPKLIDDKESPTNARVLRSSPRRPPRNDSFCSDKSNYSIHGQTNVKAERSHTELSMLNTLNITPTRTRTESSISNTSLESISNLTPIIRITRLKNNEFDSEQNSPNIANKSAPVKSLRVSGLVIDEDADLTGRVSPVLDSTSIMLSDSTVTICQEKDIEKQKGKASVKQVSRVLNKYVDVDSRPLQVDYADFCLFETKIQQGYRKLRSSETSGNVPISNDIENTNENILNKPTNDSYLTQLSYSDLDMFDTIDTNELQSHHNNNEVITVLGQKEKGTQNNNIDTSQNLAIETNSKNYNQSQSSRRLSSTNNSVFNIQTERSIADESKSSSLLATLSPALKEALSHQSVTAETDQNKPIGEFFMSILKKYRKTKMQLINFVPKIAENITNHIENLLESYLGGIVEKLPQKADRDELVRNLEIKNYKHFLSGLMQFLMSDKRNSDILCKTHTPLIPPMTKAEQALLLVLDSLQEKWPTVKLFDDVLKNMDYKLLRLNNTPTICQVENLSRFYAVICRYQNRKMHLARFIVDALYCLTFKALPLVKQVLDVWPTVLPRAGRIPTGPVNNLLVFTIVYLLHYCRCEEFGSRQTMNSIRTTLARRYGYRMTEWDDTKMLKLMRDFIYRQGSSSLQNKLLFTSFILVAKRNGVKWCQKNIVEGMLLKIINTKNTVDGVKAKCITLLGLLMRPYPNHMKLQCDVVVHTLMDIMQKNPSHTVEQSVLECLILLRRHNRLWPIEPLMYWTPKGEVSPDLMKRIKCLIQEKPLKQWKNELCDVKPNF